MPVESHLDQPSDSNRPGTGLEHKWTWAYGAYFLLGVGLLAPWNAFITATDFYEAQYGPGRHADRLFSICYLPVQLLVLASMMYDESRWPTRPRILLGLAGFCVAMIIVPALDGLTGGHLPFSVSLLAVVATAVCDGLAQGALYAEAASLPPIYTQAVVAGTAASGAILSVMRCITKAALPMTPLGLRKSADVYFVAAALVCIACLLCYSEVLPRLTVTRYSRSWTSDCPPGAKAPCPADPHLADQAANRSPTADLPLGQAIVGYRQDSELAELTRQADDLAEGPSLDDSDEGEQEEDMGVWLVVSALRSVWRLAAALVVIYSVTLAIFPGVLAEDVKSQQLGSWYPIALFTLFNFADLGGKLLPAWNTLVFHSHHGILWAAGLRMIFLPAFFVAARYSLGPVVIGLMTLALGLSNGYCTALAMMNAPIGLEGKEAAMAGQIVVFSLVLGLCIGAGCGFLWLI